MSPTSPHQQTIQFDHIGGTPSKAFPNFRHDIPSDDVIETLYQFHQQQQQQHFNYHDDNFGDGEIVGPEGQGPDADDVEDNEDSEDAQRDEDAENRLNSDDIVVPVSSNTQPHLQFPPSYHPSANQFDASTINFMNSKLQEKKSLGDHNENSAGSIHDLYPAAAIPFDSNFISTIPESFSTSTISSFESVPQTLTNSFSATSLQMSPSAQQQQHISAQSAMMTPARPLRKQSFSTITTPLQVHSQQNAASGQHPQFQQSYQTPLRKTPSMTPRGKNSHQRTRSRLSVDANGSALVVPAPSQSVSKSPGGVNPFYTPTSFMSPRIELESPQHLQQQTPFATPLHAASQQQQSQQHETGLSYLSMKKEESFRPAHKRFKSNEHIDFGVTTELTLSNLSDKLIANAGGGLLLPRSVSSMDLNQKLSSSEQHLQQHQRQKSIPQQLYQRFDKLNFIPEIQNQPYAPLVQLPESMTAGVSKLDRKKIEVVMDKNKKQKMHECPLCGGRFQRPEHVKRHMRSHSSEKPYACGICHKRFNRNDNMKAHERKIHGLERNKTVPAAGKVDDSTVQQEDD